MSRPARRSEEKPPGPRLRAGPGAIAPRSRFFLAAGAAAVALGLAVAFIPTRFTPGPVRRQAGQNVLLVTIDTLRADALGCYGRAGGTSPWIDRLAKAGVRFERAHAHNVLTLPSHTNILTGRYPFDHGVRENTGFRVPERVDTLATLLKGRGYRTAAFVSGFPLDSRFGLDRGFDVYEDSFADGQGATGFVLPERGGAATVALAQAFIGAGGTAPWFAWVHLYDPHSPYRPPAAQAAAFPQDPYLGEVAAADAALRPLLDPLLAAGEKGRTLVVLTADHGEGLGEHGERTHGFFAYETTLHVPLILFAPALLEPRVVGGSVRHVDLLPTVLHALDLPVPEDLPGRSLLPQAAGQAVPVSPSYFEALSGMLTRGWAPLVGVVDGSTKYIDLPLPELYDLDADPGELRNRVSRAPEALDRTVALLLRLRRQDPGPKPQAESAETRERLAALGYLAAARAPTEKRYTVDDDPKNLMDLDNLMQEVVRRQLDGDDEGALGLCHEIVRRRPQMPAGLLQLAHLLKKRGRLEEAISALRRAFELQPDDPAPAILLATTLTDAGQAEEAARLLEPYGTQADPQADVFITRGVALAQLGRRREALTAFGRAREIDPSNPMTLVQIATVHLTAGQEGEARAALQVALDRNPDLALAHHTLGLLAARRRDDPEAERRFRRALALEPGEADTLLNLGSLLARTGRRSEARSYLEAFLRVAPPSVYASSIDRVRRWLAGRTG